MINLSSVLNSPRMRQTFKVYHSTGYFGAGGWIEEVQSPPYFEVTGIAWPSTAREIQQVPEGDRVLGMMTFATTEPLHVTRRADSEEGTSDKIEWHGELYRVISVLPFTDYGFNVAVGARLSGD